jgi:hypothetical protein
MPGVPRDSALGKQRLAAAAKRQGGGATPQSMAKGMASKFRGQAKGPAGLTASQRASLKQTPAEKKARMDSAQGRMGTLVSNFAKRQRGEKTPTGVGRPDVLGKLFGRTSGARGAAQAVSSLSRPMKRKATRTASRSSSRR